MFHVLAPRRARRRARRGRNPTGYPFTGKYHRPKFPTNVRRKISKKSAKRGAKASAVWNVANLIASVSGRPRVRRKKAANPGRSRAKSRRPARGRSRRPSNKRRGTSSSVAAAMRAAMGRGFYPIGTRKRARLKYPKRLRGLMKQLRALGFSLKQRRKFVGGYKRRKKARWKKRGGSVGAAMRAAMSAGSYPIATNGRRKRRWKKKANGRRRRWSISLNGRRRKRARRSNPGGFSLRRIPVVGGLAGKLKIGGFSLQKGVNLAVKGIGAGAGLSASLLGPDKIAALLRKPGLARGVKGAALAGVSTVGAGMVIRALAKFLPGALGSAARSAGNFVAIGGALGVVLRLVGLYKPEIIGNYLPVNRAAQGRVIPVAPPVGGPTGKGAAGMGMMTMDELADPGYQGMNDYLELGLSGLNDYFPEGAAVAFDADTSGSESF